jgi:tetratricopeptide (TPR) repeat protein
MTKRNILLLAAISLSAGGVTPPAQTPIADLAAEIHQAETLLKAGKSAEAAQRLAYLRDAGAVTGRNRVTVVSNLAIAQMQTGQLAAAETSFAEATRLLSAWPDEHRLWAALWIAEASLARQRGRLAEARALYARVEECMRTREPDLYGVSLGNRAELERTLGDAAEAERLARRAVSFTQGPHRMAAQHTLALVLQSRGQVDEAVTLLEEVWHERKAQLGAESRAVAATQAALGAAYIEQGRWAEARTMSEEARVKLERAAGPASVEVAAVWNNLAQVAKLTGRWAEADPLYRKALDIWAQTCGKQSREFGLGLANFGDFFLTQGKGQGAAKLYTQAERIFTRALGAAHPQTRAVTARLTQARALGQQQTTGHTLRYGLTPVR